MRWDEKVKAQSLRKLFGATTLSFRGESQCGVLNLTTLGSTP